MEHAKSRPAARRGSHRLPQRRLSRRCDRRLGCYLTFRLSGRVWRPPNHLRAACQLLGAYVRLAEKDRRQNPNWYGPHHALRQLERQRFEEDWRQALERVYGASALDNRQSLFEIPWGHGRLRPVHSGRARAAPDKFNR